MPNKSDRSESSAPKQISHQKRLGSYLVEAGLLSPGQIDVALNDQKLTGMRFGDVLVTRGWVKQQTIEYLMRKVILPERQALTQNHPTAARSASSTAHQPLRSKASGEARHDAPISKPLPSIRPTGEDVSWVG